MFTATVTNPPGTGTITLDLLNKTTNTVQNRLTIFPDSLRLRIKTAGGVPSGNYTIRVQGNGPNGTPVHERLININMGFVGISTNTNQIPDKYSLLQNYPNPFNPSTKISFSLPVSGSVNLSVYDINGRLVEETLNKNLSAGYHNFEWNAVNYPSGIYFYKLTSGNFTEVKKMILIK